MTELFVDPTGVDALTRFVAHVLLVAACTGVSIYTVLNIRARTVQSSMWRYLFLSGVVGVGYGLLAIVETVAAGGAIASNPVTVGAFRRVSQLFFIVFLALAMRELYYESPHESDELLASLSPRTIRLLEAGFLTVIMIEFVVVILLGFVTVARVVQLAASVAFTAYGVSFALPIKSAAMTSRTVLDTMVTYVIAVMITAGAASAIEIGYVVGIPPAAVESTAVVLTVMTGTFLVALTIRLKQNVDGRRY